MALTFTKIAATFLLQKNIHEPYFFFTIRNGFEAAFRSTVDCRMQDCTGCRRGNDCVLPQIFSQALTADPSAIRRYQKPSLPFVFHFPRLPNPLEKGMTVTLEIILIGQASAYYNNFVHSLSTLVQDTAVLVRAESIDYSGNRYLLIDGENIIYPDRLFLFSFEEVQNSCRQLSAEIAIRLVTPMILLQQGRPIRDLSFSPFIRALFRRVSSLAYYYGGTEMECDFKHLSERSTEIRTVTSDFVWVDLAPVSKGAKLGGIMGSAVYSGDLDPFYPFLLFGEYFNVGKGASFGRGEFRIE